MMEKSLLTLFSYSGTQQTSRFCEYCLELSWTRVESGKHPPTHTHDMYLHMFIINMQFNFTILVTNWEWHSSIVIYSTISNQIIYVCACHEPCGHITKQQRRQRLVGLYTPRNWVRYLDLIKKNEAIGLVVEMRRETIKKAQIPNSNALWKYKRAKVGGGG